MTSSSSALCQNELGDEMGHDSVTTAVLNTWLFLARLSVFPESSQSLLC